MFKSKLNISLVLSIMVMVVLCTFIFENKVNAFSICSCRGSCGYACDGDLECRQIVSGPCQEVSNPQSTCQNYTIYGGGQCGEQYRTDFIIAVCGTRIGPCGGTITSVGLGC